MKGKAHMCALQCSVRRVRRIGGEKGSVHVHVRACVLCCACVCGVLCVVCDTHCEPFGVVPSSMKTPLIGTVEPFG